MSRPKQVIVVRKDLKMRRGKEIAQGAHASMAAILGLGRLGGEGLARCFSLPLPTGSATLEAVWEWLEGAFTKVTVTVDSEEALLAVHAAAKAACLPTSLIKDSGQTEFGGVPTHTTVAVGPARPELVDPITGHLKLY